MKEHWDTERIDALQERGQKFADGHFGVGHAVVGRPLPHGEGFCCIVSVGKRAAWCAWEGRNMVSAIRLAILDAEQ